jgi:hypothetical protein
MGVAGASRDRLVSTLNAAYASGLISDNTLAFRLEQVFHRTLIDPSLLIGDLSRRQEREPIRARMVRSLTVAIAEVRAARRRSYEPDALLALDWNEPEHELVVGRSSACDIVISDESVSRRHARLMPRDGAWILQDLDSTNGSFVNGSRVGRCSLVPGDDVWLGGFLLRVD